MCDDIEVPESFSMRSEKLYLRRTSNHIDYLWKWGHAITLPFRNHYMVNCHGIKDKISFEKYQGNLIEKSICIKITISIHTFTKLLLLLTAQTMSGWF